jgi:hypothetical protein
MARRAAAADMHAIPQHTVEAVPQLASLSLTVFLLNQMRLSSDPTMVSPSFMTSELAQGGCSTF